MTEPPNEPPAGQPGPPPPPPMPYAGQPPPPVAHRNGMGVAALVLAIIGLLFCWSVFGGVILGILAVIFGFIGRGRAKRGEATNGGVALAGVILGFLSLVLGLAFIAIWSIFWVEVFGGSNFVDCMNKAGNDTAAQQKCSDEFQHHLETKFSVTLTPTENP